MEKQIRFASKPPTFSDTNITMQALLDDLAKLMETLNVKCK